MKALPKAPTGIKGLDEITFGGLPKGRPTLICGSAGCGKTLMAMEFLVRGAIEFGEPGVFISFEESGEELTQNVRSLGFDLDELVDRKQLAVDYIHLDPAEIHETGEYDLEGLFIRLNLAIESIGAKRIALDTIEALFGGLSNLAVLRGELRRLFRWLKNKGVTAVITGERGDGKLTRQGLEEYVSDCVILLDHRVDDQISTRRLRIVKYRGSAHGNNEYPFLIDEAGIDVLPVTSLQLNHEVTDQRVSTGVQRLDAMLGGNGVYRGSTVMISGTAGTGKSSLAACFADASCRRGERCLYFSFEESPAQIVRNMRSIGMDLEPWVKKGKLKFVASRPTLHGLEDHLMTVHKHLRDFQPRLIIMDPISDLSSVGTVRDVKSMLVRMIDALKSQQVTAVLTNLNTGAGIHEDTEMGISSVVDTWLLVRDFEVGGERNRGLYILKSRGMAHSNQVREFLLSSQGIDLLDVYTGPEGVLTGSARLAQELRDQATQKVQEQDTSRRAREAERKRLLLEAQMTALQAEIESLADESGRSARQEKDRLTSVDDARQAMARSRRADSVTEVHQNGPMSRKRSARQHS